MTYSAQIKYDKKVIVQTYEPNALSMQNLIREHKESTDTELSEWTVAVERHTNEVLHNMLAPTNKYRWEITLTRRII